MRVPPGAGRGEVREQGAEARRAGKRGAERHTVRDRETRETACASRRAREEMPPPKIGDGVGYMAHMSHVEEWGEKDDSRPTTVRLWSGRGTGGYKRSPYKL